MLARLTEKASQQRGVALITVLLIIAILTAIISRLSFSNQLWLRQVANGASLNQSRLATRAVQNWVSLILLKDDNDYDGHMDLWAQPFSPLPVGNGFVLGHIEDMQGRFNLNNLDQDNDTDRNALKQFERLLRLLDLNPGIAEAAVDWMDSDDKITGIWGAEDGYYLGMDPPYLAANRPFQDASELRQVRGVDRNTWYKLKPFVTALPEAGTLMNINTASPEVLAAIITEWGLPQEAIIEARRWSEMTNETPFRSIEDFYEQAPGFDDDELPDVLTVSSQFFMAHTQVEISGTRDRMASLYKRDKARAVVISQWREFE